MIFSVNKSTHRHRSFQHLTWEIKVNGDQDLNSPRHLSWRLRKASIGIQRQLDNRLCAGEDLLRVECEQVSLLADLRCFFFFRWPLVFVLVACFLQESADLVFSLFCLF